MISVLGEESGGGAWGGGQRCCLSSAGGTKYLTAEDPGYRGQSNRTLDEFASPVPSPPDVVRQTEPPSPLPPRPKCLQASAICSAASAAPCTPARFLSQPGCGSVAVYWLCWVVDLLGGGGSMLVGFYVLGDRIVFSENFEFSEIST